MAQGMLGPIVVEFEEPLFFSGRKDQRHAGKDAIALSSGLARVSACSYWDGRFDTSYVLLVVLRTRSKLLTAVPKGVIIY